MDQKGVPQPGYILRVKADIFTIAGNVNKELLFLAQGLAQHDFHLRFREIGVACFLEAVHVVLAQCCGAVNRSAVEDPLESADGYVVAVLHSRWREGMIWSGNGKVHDANMDGGLCLAHDRCCFVARSDSHYLNGGHAETNGLPEHLLCIL